MGDNVGFLKSNVAYPTDAGLLTKAVGKIAATAGRSGLRQRHSDEAGLADLADTARRRGWSAVGQHEVGAAVQTSVHG